jgi:hypothetical protein
LPAGIVVPRPSGLAWSEQLQAELAATSESMKVAQQKLSEEREMRVSALQAENKAQLEARLARQAAREAARDQRDTERRMLITAGGMRDQREKLEHELVRLNDQQDELHQELEAQRKRALEAELVAENAIEEARVKLERQQAEFDERVRIVEAERAEQARLERIALARGRLGLLEELVERFGGCAGASGGPYAPGARRGGEDDWQDETHERRDALLLHHEARVVGMLRNQRAHSRSAGELVELFGGAEQPHECRYGASRGDRALVGAMGASEVG